ncbi:MAG: class I SAM-dependent methyltransferase, partial [Lachnospiraceae bacterium]|nr:class I SAM-dependent methyltransferase [Lachnospiraceae bacterium]
MIRSEDVIQFFDRLAGSWDADMVRNEDVIRLILDHARVREGVSVLDVASGTGVLFPDYLDRNVRHITGVDISPEMTRIASEKFGGNDRIRLYCSDIETFTAEEPFDVVMVYNAFPHFPDPKRLIETLSGFLSEGGRLSIAHGMSREAIDRHHSGPAALVSNRLMPVEELSGLMKPYFEIETAVSDERMYQ